MTILDRLHAGISQRLQGQLRPAVLWEREEVSDGGGGTVEDWTTPHVCEGVRGSYSAEIAGPAGIPREDVRVEILAASLDFTPRRQDKVNIEGEWFLIVEVEKDPSTTLWTLQCADTSPVD